jgi:hypothetical protein
MADPRTTPFAWFCRSLGMGAFGRGSEALDLLGRPEVPGAADVLAARGMVELWLDQPAVAVDHLGVAFARARAGELVRVTQAIGFLSEAEYRLGRFSEAEVHGELAVQAAHDAGRVWDLPLLHALAAYPSAARGDFDAAERHVRAAEDWALLVPIPGFRGYAAHARIALALARGAALDRFEARALHAGRRSALLGAARLRGLLHAVRGDHAGAEAQFR